MSFLTNALGGNPFSTIVGSKIEQATDGTLASENWALNMEICDLVNETEDGPRDAVKAIKKRLQQNVGKNYTVVMYTLTVLETCVKNCGRPFHILACSKDFVQELVKLIGPKNDPPTAIQEKVLSLIQSWADAFKTIPELSGVVQVYQELLAKGIEFPPTDLDAMAPIHTPQRSVDDDRSVSPRTNLPQDAVISPTSYLTPEQRAKLQSELDVVQSNIAVLSELLNELKPGQEQSDELELLQELHATCQSMQERLVDLINKLSNDEITAELLRINDDMNNLFLRYSRWDKNREAGGQSASTVLARAVAPTVTAKTNDNDSLIDLSGPNDLSSQLSKLIVNSPSASTQLEKIDTVTTKNGPHCDEFDTFAQSRKVTCDFSKTSGNTYKDNIGPDQISTGLSTAAQKQQHNNPKDLEFDEMEQWLGTTTAGNEESVTSSEFERFLAERAAAAENQPSTTTNSSTSKGKAEKDSLFAI